MNFTLDKPAAVQGVVFHDGTMPTGGKLYSVLGPTNKESVRQAVIFRPDDDLEELARLTKLTKPQVRDALIRLRKERKLDMNGRWGFKWRV